MKAGAKFLVAACAVLGLALIPGTVGRATVPQAQPVTVTAQYILPGDAAVNCLGSAVPAQVRNQGGACFTVPPIPDPTTALCGTVACSSESVTAVTIADQQFAAVDGGYNWQDAKGNNVGGAGSICQGGTSFTDGTATVTEIPVPNAAVGGGTMFVFPGSAIDWASPTVGPVQDGYVGCNQQGSPNAVAGTITVTFSFS